MTAYPRQQFCLAVIAGTPALSACFVTLRIWARRRSQIPLGWDDYSIILAALLSIGLIFPSFRNVYMWHYGIHIWDVDQKEREPDMDEYHKVLIAFNLIHTLILPLVRASIILLLLRAAWVINRIRIVLYIILAFNIGACLGPWLAMLFMCPPRTNNTYAPTVFNGLSCLDPWQAAIVYVFVVTVNMFTDLLVFPIPCVLVWRLRNTTRRSRLALIFPFALSLSVTVMAAVRLKLNFESMLYKKASSDWTYTIIYCLNHAENNAAIIVACVPLLRGLFPNRTSSGDEQTEISCGPHSKKPRVERESFIRLERVNGSRESNSMSQDKTLNDSDNTLVEDIRNPEACVTAKGYYKTERDLEFS